MNTTGEKLDEGYSTQRPPMFNGKHFAYWRNRMEIFIKAENYQVWRVIELGDFDVTSTNEKGEVIPKPLSKYDKDDYEKMEMNNLAKKLLHCGLGPHEHNRVMGCKTAKQMWELLQVTHEGTSEVKRSKIDMLMHKYELFQMKPKEPVHDMLTRFSNIINELESLGKIITPEEQVRKVLRSLPQDERWMAKVTALQETKDFTTFNIEQLAGSLMTHELHLGTQEVETSKPKTLALKAEDLEDSETDDEEAAMLVRKFRKFYNKNYKGKASKKPTKYSCHKCGSPDHFIKDCPLWENEKGKGKSKEKGKEYQKPYSKNDLKKAMIAAWGESDSEEEQEQPEDESAYLCLMARNDDQEEQQTSKVCLRSIEKDLMGLNKEKLLELLIETLDDYKEVCLKNKQIEKALSITKEHTSWLNTLRSDIEKRFFDLFDKNRIIQENFEKVKNENFLLNMKLAELTLFVPEESVPNSESKLEFEKSKLEYEIMINAKQKKELVPPDEKLPDVVSWINKYQNKGKDGLGFNHKRNNKKKKYVDLPMNKVCTFCGKSGHLVTDCYHKKKQTERNSVYVKSIWREKFDSDLTKEPKQDWVPPIN